MTELSARRRLRERADQDSIDRSLLERIVAGDRAALHKLYVGYYQRLLRFLYRITGQLELAQEGINDVMLVVWEKGRTFSGRSTVSTWIMCIAYRKGLKLREKSRRWSDRFKAADIHDWNEPFLPSEKPTEEVVTQDLLARALRQLSPEQRAVVELTYFHGYSYQEISEIAGCPVNTVKTRMFHARAKLRTILPALGADGPRS